MNAILLVILSASVINLTLGLMGWENKRRTIGIIKCQWSERLDPRIPRNWPWFGFLVLYLTACIYFAFFSASTMGRFVLPVLLILVLSSWPRWNVAIGSQGVVLGIRRIDAGDIVVWQHVKKGRSRYFFIRWAEGGGTSILKERMIATPFAGIGLKNS